MPNLSASIFGENGKNAGMISNMLKKVSLKSQQKKETTHDHIYLKFSRYSLYDWHDLVCTNCSLSLHHKVPAKQFPEYQTLHMNWTSWVVIPPMVTELFTSIWLCYQPPEELNSQWLYALTGSLLLIWISTGLIQAPTHSKLRSHLDISLHRRLVTSNWIRTVLWSTRSVFLLILLSNALN